MFNLALGPTICVGICSNQSSVTTRNDGAGNLIIYIPANTVITFAASGAGFYADGLGNYYYSGLPIQYAIRHFGNANGINFDIWSPKYNLQFNTSTQAYTRAVNEDFQTFNPAIDTIGLTAELAFFYGTQSVPGSGAAQFHGTVGSYTFP